MLTQQASSIRRPETDVRGRPETYAKLIKNAGVPTDKIHFVATSASRREESRRVFRGHQVTAGRAAGRDQWRRGGAPPSLARSAASAPKDPVLVMDIGGGSTEFIVGSSAGVMESAISLDIGSVRLTERFLKVSPPAEDDLARAADYVDRMLEESGVDFGSVGTWIGVAGTATTLAGVYLELEHYDRDRAHGSRIPRHDVGGLLRQLSGLTVPEIRSLPSMHPDRADDHGRYPGRRPGGRAARVAHMVVG